MIQQLPVVLKHAQASRADWAALQELQFAAQEVLTRFAGRAPHGSSGARSLGGQVALPGDVLSGALRRLSVPAESAATCASGLAAAVASLFGLVVSPDEP